MTQPTTLNRCPNSWGQYSRIEGREEGRQEGREEGRQEGREEGRQEGREEGRQEGREEGLEKGRLETALALLLLLGGKRFGEPDAGTLATLQAITSVDRLQELVARLLDVLSWQELLA